MNANMPSSALPPPPKFASPSTGQGPATVDDWMQFIRWLYQLYGRTVENINAAQSLTFAAQGMPVTSGEQIVGETQVLRQPPVGGHQSGLPAGGPISPPPDAQRAAHANELDALVTLALTRQPGKSGSGLLVIEDTHANRLLNYPAANYPVGTLFYETNSTQTDRQSLYLVQAFSGVNQWIFVAGLFAAALGNRPADLGIYDAGFHFYAVDYTVGEDWNGTQWVYRYGRSYGGHGILAALASTLTAQDTGWLASDEQYGHRFYWNATVWAFEPGEESQYIAMASSTAAPKGGPWYPCDGGTYACENSDGTTTNVTTPNLNTPVAAIMSGGFHATVYPATAPTLASGVVIGNDSDAGADVVPAGSTLVALNPHSHTVTNAVINAPSVANGGLPAYFTTAWYLRA